MNSRLASSSCANVCNGNRVEGVAFNSCFGQFSSVRYRSSKQGNMHSHTAFIRGKTNRRGTRGIAYSEHPSSNRSLAISGPRGRSSARSRFGGTLASASQRSTVLPRCRRPRSQCSKSRRTACPRRAAPALLGHQRLKELQSSTRHLVRLT